MDSSAPPTAAKPDLSLDVEALRRQLGPVKVGLIDRWIREVNGPLDAAIAAHVDPDAWVLDVGCSRGDPDLPSIRSGHRLVGCDVDVLGLRANELAEGCVMAPSTSTPFADASFDVIVGKWLLEHLEDPAADFREFHRLLRPGGAVVVLTPNRFSLFTFLSAVIPLRLKQGLKRNIFGIHEEDTFPAFYRANSRWRLSRLMAQAGFENERLFLLPGMWTFFIFSPRLARMVRVLERLQARIPVIRASTTYIIGVWKKPGTTRVPRGHAGPGEGT